MSQNDKIGSVLQGADSPCAKKMLKLIVEEGKQDEDHLDWWRTMQSTPRRSTRSTLHGEIESLETTIDNPENVLKAQIKEADESLESCVTRQKTETNERTDATVLC